MNKLDRKELIHISVMLFGLFFGAGNLIFPPLLGNQAGSSTLIALISFSVTAVIFPVLGVIAVSKTQGLTNLSSRVGKKFAIIYSTIIFLSIGPGLAIPRAGSVPFEMAVAPYLPEDINIIPIRITYTFIFFLFAYLISIKPNKLIKNVGKILTPALLILIIYMFYKALSNPNIVVDPVGDYAVNPISKGFIQGYNTMDAIAALNFGLVISLSIKGLGIEDEKEITKYTLKSGIIAGVLLFIVYGMLAYIGASTSSYLVGAENGAVILSKAMANFGILGVILLASIFFLACLTTCVGLITSGGEYFNSLSKNKLSYKIWVFILSFTSFITSNFGLDAILSVSIPVLSVIYPVALILILMGISHDLVEYPRSAYVITTIISIILPLIFTLNNSNIFIPILSPLEMSLPLANKGLSWVVPSIISVFIFTIIDKVKIKKGI